MLGQRKKYTMNAECRMHNAELWCPSDNVLTIRGKSFCFRIVIIIVAIRQHINSAF